MDAHKFGISTTIIKVNSCPNMDDGHDLITVKMDYVSRKLDRI